MIGWVFHIASAYFWHVIAVWVCMSVYVCVCVYCMGKRVCRKTCHHLDKTSQKLVQWVLNFTYFYFSSWTMLVWVLSLFSHVWLCDTVHCSSPGSSVQGVSRQESWKGFPCHPPGDLPDPGIKPMSPALQLDSLLLSHQGRSSWAIIKMK